MNSGESRVEKGKKSSKSVSPVGSVRLLLYLISFLTRKPKTKIKTADKGGGSRGLCMTSRIEKDHGKESKNKMATVSFIVNNGFPH